MSQQRRTPTPSGEPCLHLESAYNATREVFNIQCGGCGGLALEISRREGATLGFAATERAAISEELGSHPDAASLVAALERVVMRQQLNLIWADRRSAEQQDADRKALRSFARAMDTALALYFGSPAVRDVLRLKPVVPLKPNGEIADGTGDTVIVPLSFPPARLTDLELRLRLHAMYSASCEAKEANKPPAGRPTRWVQRALAYWLASWFRRYGLKDGSETAARVYNVMHVAVVGEELRDPKRRYLALKKRLHFRSPAVEQRILREAEERHQQHGAEAQKPEVQKPPRRAKEILHLDQPRSDA